MSNAPITFGIQTVQALRDARISFTMAPYSAKTPLYPQGVLIDAVFLVASGIVKLTHTDPDGREIIVGIRRPGRMLGVTEAILNRAQPTGAVALTHCRLLRIPATEVRGLLGSDSAFCRYLIELQAQEVQDHLENVVELASCSTEYRLVRLLSELVSDIHPPRLGVEDNRRIPFKQWEIAELLAVTPEHICRVLRQLEQAGLVRRKGKVLFVQQPERLLSFIDP